MKKKKILWIMAAMLLAGCGKGDGQTVNEQPTQAVEDVKNDPEVTEAAEQPTPTEAVPEEPTLEAKSYKAEEQYVKSFGRNEMYQDILWLAQSASGVEFTFTGTSASITMAADSTLTTGTTNRARFAIYVNGERVVDEQVKKMLNTYEVFTSEEPAETTIKIVKLSEAGNSTVGIKSIDVMCAGDIQPTPEKDLKIEFIGDSITCGYGVDDENRDHHFSTETEDATKTYAYKTAEQLNADYSFVSYSGNGIISGYSGDGNRVTEQLVPDKYAFSAVTGGKFGDFSMSEVEWDFDRFVPDYIVINLGTNDHSYVGSDKEKRQLYIDDYVKFLKQVREKNPDAHIICALGVMGDQLYSAVEEVVANYQAETQDAKVSALHFTPHDGSTGFAADWHPTEATHEIAASELVKEIQRLQGE